MTHVSVTESRNEVRFLKTFSCYIQWRTLRLCCFKQRVYSPMNPCSVPRQYSFGVSTAYPLRYISCVEYILDFWVYARFSQHEFHRCWLLKEILYLWTYRSPLLSPKLFILGRYRHSMLVPSTECPIIGGIINKNKIFL